MYGKKGNKCVYARTPTQLPTIGTAFSQQNCIGVRGKYCNFYRHIKGQTVKSCWKECKNNKKCISFSLHDEIGDCYISKPGCTMRRHPKLMFYKMGSNCFSPYPLDYEDIDLDADGGGYGESIITTINTTSMTIKTI